MRDLGNGEKKRSLIQGVNGKDDAIDSKQAKQDLIRLREELGQRQGSML